MSIIEFQKLVDHETQWLKYYGYRPSRKADDYNDHLFYERLESIGYTKVIMPLPNRCVGAFITSDKPVLESTIEELRTIGSPRNHSKNIFTPLEYMMSKKILNYLDCIRILKEI